VDGEVLTGGDLERLALELQGDLEVRDRRVALRDVGVGRAVVPERALLTIRSPGWIPR
jgi:hypothetical protein